MAERLVRRHGHNCPPTGDCPVCERIAEDRYDDEVETGPTTDPRSRWGHPADWNFPRGGGWD
jgi:hypothetical protein